MSIYDIYLYSLFFTRIRYKYNIRRKKDPSIDAYVRLETFLSSLRLSLSFHVSIATHFVYIYLVYIVRCCGVVFTRFRRTVLLFECRRLIGGLKVCHYVAAINSKKLLSFLAYNFVRVVSFPTGREKCYKTFRRIERTMTSSVQRERSGGRNTYV